MKINIPGFKTLVILLLIVFLAACATPEPLPSASGSSGDSSSGSDEGESSSSSEDSSDSSDTTSSGESGSDADPVETVKLKIVSLPFITFSPFYIADEEGFFAEQGLEVEFVDMRVQEEIIPALSSGQVDVSSGLLSAGILNAISREANIKITADKGYIDPDGCTNYTVIGRADLIDAGEFQTPDQLAGKTINVVTATWLEYYLDVVLDSGGLGLEDVEKINLSTWVVPEAFGEQSIDAAVNSEPWVTRLQGSGHLSVLGLPQALLPNDSAAVMVYGPNLLGDNIDVGSRFMVAYLKGVRQYQEGKTDRNIDIVGRFTELDRELLEAMCWPALNPTGEISTDNLLAFQEWAIEQGYVDSALTAEELYDPRFVNEANSILDNE